MKNSLDFRIGIGQDSHRFLKKSFKKPLILGGVRIADHGGLDGRSDADAIIHSLCNALSSAIGGDSLSTWSDEMCQKGVCDSQKYLEFIFNAISQKNYRVVNVSIAVEAKKPFFEQKVVDRMKKTLAEILEISKNRIGITFTSGEGLTVFGKGLGIQSFCQVLLCPKN